MDDQVLATLKQVRSARNEVNLARLDRTLAPDMLGKLSQLYLDLDDLEGKLILGDLRAQLDGLRQDAADLGAVVAQMRQAADSLKQLADKVHLAVTAVNAVVSVAQAAASVGVLPAAT